MTQAMIYLTDGFARLDLPGRLSTFHLDDDWVARGTECEWIWPHRQPCTVAGAEIVADGGMICTIDVSGMDKRPILLRKNEMIKINPSVEMTFIDDSN